MANKNNAAVVKVVALNTLTVATTVQLSRRCRQLRISLDAGSSDLYIQILGDVASIGGADSIKIASGTTWESLAQGNLDIDRLSVIASAGIGNATFFGM